MKDKLWEKTRITNLLRNSASEKYYARCTVQGRQVWKALGTDSFTRAQILLPDALKEMREKATRAVETVETTVENQTEMGAWIDRAVVHAELKIHKASTLLRYKIAAKALRFSWDGLPKRDVRRITEADCLAWAKAAPGQGTGLSSPLAVGGKKIYTAKKAMSASAFNQCLTVLRDAFALAIKHGMIYRDPSATVSRMSPPPKRLELPTKQQFQDLASAIGSSGAAQAKDCEFLVRFLATSGARISEAAACTWELVDWNRESLHVPGKKTRSSNRDIPLFPALAALLQAVPVEKRNGPICPVKEAQNAITTACKKLGIKRLTHHDLRHLFATTCIEAGVDIPTVSRWLGHSDGGALAMRTYGHLRSEHSNRMAQLVTL